MVVETVSELLIIMCYVLPGMPLALISLLTLTLTCANVTGTHSHIFGQTEGGSADSDSDDIRHAMDSSSRRKSREIC